MRELLTLRRCVLLHRLFELVETRIPLGNCRHPEILAGWLFVGDGFDEMPGFTPNFAATS